MQWITLEEAEREGLDLSAVAAAIGPRRVGMVYRCREWGTVNTVLSVEVRVERFNNAPLRVVRDWMVCERGGSGPDGTRYTARSPWYQDPGVILHGPADIRPRAER